MSGACPLCVCAQPAKEGDCAGKGWMIAAMTLAIIQLIIVGWFGFIGIVLATVCEGVDDALDGSNCLYECHDAFGLHSEEACTSPDGYTGTDCCASMDWYEPQTCADGFRVVPASGEAKEAVRDFCDLMGLMTLTAIARFALVLTVAISSCCAVCCAPTPPPAATAYQGQPTIQAGVPMAAVGVPAQIVAVPAHAVAVSAKP